MKKIITISALSTVIFALSSCNTIKEVKDRTTDTGKNVWGKTKSVTKSTMDTGKNVGKGAMDAGKGMTKAVGKDVNKMMNR